MLAVTLAMTGCVSNKEAEVRYVPYAPAEHEMREITSFELMSEIKTGWNLGNSFDSRGFGLGAESAWGNPATTYEMIRAVAAAGFDAIRVPVTWENQVDPAPDYTVNEMWLDRVEEVVGYVLSTGMYCIINTHHEDNIFPTDEKLKENSAFLSLLWKQIAERFKNYNHKLIFEGMNEPRLKDTEHEWNGGTPEARAVVNKLNGEFVKAVRSTGGNNRTRHLMVPTYAASVETHALKDLADYFDTLWEHGGNGKDKLIASVHAYTPNVFALNPKGTGTWNSGAFEQDIDWVFDRLQRQFLDNGIPVIMGECGAVDKGDLESRVAWTMYYFGVARKYGIPAFWWDNGVFNARGPDDDTTEIFGMLNRHEARFVFPEVIEAIMNPTDMTDS